MDMTQANSTSPSFEGPALRLAGVAQSASLTPCTPEQLEQLLAVLGVLRREPLGRHRLACAVPLQELLDQQIERVARGVVRSAHASPSPPR